MINIDLGVIEVYNPATNTFTSKDCGVVGFEYSLKTLYNWEGKYQKPFIGGNPTYEEIKDFYCMMADREIDSDFMTDDVMALLSKYVSSEQTATTFNNIREGQNGDTKGKRYTSEELYALMLMAGLPMEFENHNLNRVLIIMKIMKSYNEPSKKMTKSEVMQQNSDLNAKRRAKYNTKG